MNVCYAENGMPITDDFIEETEQEVISGFPHSYVEVIPLTHAAAPRRQRSIRIDDALWDLACKKAQEEGVPTSEIVRESLIKLLAA